MRARIPRLAHSSARRIAVMAPPNPEPTMAMSTDSILLLLGKVAVHGDGPRLVTVHVRDAVVREVRRPAVVEVVCEILVRGDPDRDEALVVPRRREERDHHGRAGVLIERPTRPVPLSFHDHGLLGEREVLETRPSV